MIASAVSASLGKHHSLKGNKKALSTVTAVIEGTGSLGASVLQIIIPHLSDIFGLFVGELEKLAKGVKGNVVLT